MNGHPAKGGFLVNGEVWGKETVVEVILDQRNSDIHSVVAGNRGSELHVVVESLECVLECSQGRVWTSPKAEHIIHIAVPKEEVSRISPAVKGPSF